MSEAFKLTVRKTVKAPRERVFSAWAEPDQLMKWWGPKDVVCTAASIDFTVGGGYRIENQFADEATVWIVGEYLEITPPRKIVFTWKLENFDADAEQVSIELFERSADETEVVITHTRIGDAETYNTHMAGWDGCLDGLSEYLRRQ